MRAVIEPRLSGTTPGVINVMVLWSVIISTVRIGHLEVWSIRNLNSGGYVVFNSMGPWCPYKHLS